jgi:hypothetical protein
MTPHIVVRGKQLDRAEGGCDGEVDDIVDFPPSLLSAPNQTGDVDGSEPARPCTCHAPPGAGISTVTQALDHPGRIGM